MALTNAQYDEIMRGYDKRQLQNKYIHDKRIEEAYRKAPRLREIDSEIASASVRQAYRLMDGDENALAALRLAIEDYKEERAALLSTLGYPLDYFDYRYLKLGRPPRHRRLWQQPRPWRCRHFRRVGHWLSQRRYQR